MKSKNKIIQISCDGGAATGKSTGAKLISKKYGLKIFLFNFEFLETLGFLTSCFKNLNFENMRVKKHQVLKTSRFLKA